MRFRIATLAAACMVLSGAAHATTTVSNAGTRVTVNGAAATDGQTLGGAEFNGSSDPAPFDILYGRDSASNFSVSWSQAYTAIADPITAATLQLGIFDVDGDVAGDQVGSFTLNGIDLTAALNASVNAKTFTGDSKYGIYDLDLSAATFTALATGRLEFALALSGPARNVLGSTRFNAAILDYSSLTVTSNAVTPPTPPVQPSVPEPATWAMMLAGFGMVGAGVRRRPARRPIVA